MIEQVRFVSTRLLKVDMDIAWNLYHHESNRIVRAIEDSDSAVLVAETLGWAIGEMLARIAAAHRPQTAMDTGLTFASLITRIRHHIAIEEDFDTVGASFRLEDIGDRIFLPGTTECDNERDRLTDIISAAKPSDCLALIDALGKIIAYGSTEADREFAQIKALEAAADGYLSGMQVEAQH